MSTDANKAVVLGFIERAFNDGDLTSLDELLAQDGIDYQEPPGTDFRRHIKQVVTSLRTAFPDLHFEIHHVLAEGDIVAFHSTMTGTHQGILNLGPAHVPPTGRKISVAHMHFVRVVDGQGYELWHVWDTPTMLRQLGVMPEPQRRSA